MGFDPFYCIPGKEGAHEKSGVEGEGGRFRRTHLVPVPRVDSLVELNALLLALYRAKTSIGGVSWGFRARSGGSSVFVDHSVEDLVATDWRVDRDGDARVVVGRAVLASLVGSVVVEMPNVLV